MGVWANVEAWETSVGGSRYSVRKCWSFQQDTADSKHKDEASLRCGLGSVPKSRSVTV